MQTYDEILTRMQSKFLELSGCLPDDASDIGIRLRVLAGEVFSLLVETDWVKNQCFPQTAQGDHLAQMAQQYGLGRREPAYADGVLEMKRATPLWADAVVPLGTVCGAGNPPVRFVTTRQAILPKGQTKLTVEARAECPGKSGNAAAGSITAFVTAPGGIETVNNPAPFTGGADREDDAALRERLLKSLRGCINGANAAWYRETAEKHPQVYSASVQKRPNGPGTVAVYLAGCGSAAPAAAVDDLKALFTRYRELNTDVTVAPVKLQAVDAAFRVVPAQGKTFATVKDGLLALIKDFFAEMKAGESFFRARLQGFLSASGLVDVCELEENITRDTKIPPDTLAVPGALSVAEKVVRE